MFSPGHKASQREGRKRGERVYRARQEEKHLGWDTPSSDKWGVAPAHTEPRWDRETARNGFCPVEPEIVRYLTGGSCKTFTVSSGPHMAASKTLDK